MPSYDYKCKECGHVFQERHSISKHTPTSTCPECKKTAVQVYITPPVYSISGLPKNRF